MEQEQDIRIARLNLHYKTESLLHAACAAIERTLNLKVEIVEAYWEISKLSNNPIFCIKYITGATENDIHIIHVSERLFTEPYIKGDDKSGANKLTNQQAKIIIRLARAIYTHSN